MCKRILNVDLFLFTVNSQSSALRLICCHQIGPNKYSGSMQASGNYIRLLIAQQGVAHGLVVQVERESGLRAMRWEHQSAESYEVMFRVLSCRALLLHSATLNLPHYYSGFITTPINNLLNCLYPQNFVSVDLIRLLY